MSSSSWSIEQGRVFFLGAGFSAGAGIPLMDSVLSEALKICKTEIPGIYERIESYAIGADVDLNSPITATDFTRFSTYLDFAELREHGGGERFSEQGSRERVCLKFCLAKAVALNSPAPGSIPATYLKFASQLNPADVVISFNWDTLLENALDAVGQAYNYEYKPDSISIVKLHGSLNWHRYKSGQTPDPSFRLPHKRLDYEAYGSGDFYVSSDLNIPSNWASISGANLAFKPFLVLPGFGKAYDVRFLSPIWYRPEFLGLRVGGVSIIGLSVSEDDFLVEGLFRYLFRQVFEKHKVRVLNPDKSVEGRFSQLIGGNLKLDFKPEKFDETTLDFALLT